eukprot:151231-Pyramimonas_sp.AAC.1
MFLLWVSSGVMFGARPNSHARAHRAGIRFGPEAHADPRGKAQRGSSSPLAQRRPRPNLAVP